jgi:hypothetical protein
VNELNSEKFKNYEKDDLESINNEFRSETIELIYSYNRQFLLGE